MAIRPIEILINARDNASGVFAKLDGKLKAMGVAIAGYFGVKAFAGIVSSAADFEEAMSKVQAATGASGDELAKLKQTAEDAGASTKFTAVESAGALENLAKAGLSATDSIAALPAVLELAQAGGIDLAQASEFMTKAVMGMGLSFDEAGRVADVLAKGANASNTSVTGLAQALSYVAPIANTLGVSLEGTVAIVGKFADAGIDASRAGTALNSIMSQFADPASKFRSELAAAGITTNDFEKALHQLAAAGPAGSKAINSVGLEAGPALRALLNQGMGALDELKGKLNDAAGSAKETAAVMGNNLNGAFKGLSSAWETVTTVLGTPVLPILTKAVNDMADAFRSAVADGTVAKFGESISAGFQAGIKWAREFLATIDFTKLASDLRAFADRTGEVFNQIGEYARNAGNIVQTAYGVMSAGTNAVLTAVYGIGAAFTGVASNIQSGVALLYDLLAKVTFGNVSKAYKEAADSIRLSAEATWAASEELEKKATAAFIAVETGAVLARDGFNGLAGGATAASNAVAGVKQPVDAAAKAVADLSEEMRKEAEAAYIAKEAEEKKAGAHAAAQQAAEEHRAALAKLREEYAALVASGDLQGAATKLGEINAKLKETPTAAGAAGKALADTGKAAQEAALQIEMAFGRLGVVSSDALAKAAAGAKRDFETIKTSGTATAEDIGKAFAAYAEKAIAANGGVANSTIKAEAALRGYKVVVDDAGKAAVQLVAANDSAGASFARAAEAIKAKAMAVQADNALIASSLQLRKSQVDAALAIAQAQGDETKVIKLKIEQKRIEIEIIKQAVRAQIAEAESSIELAKAKKAELSASGNLNPEKRAEIDASIKAAQVKINEAKARGQSVRVLEEEIKGLKESTGAHSANASAIDKTTAALEKLNREKERQIAAQEKANELLEREAELHRKKWNIDKEGYTLDANGKRLEVNGQTQQSLYNSGKDAGLTAEQAKRLADQYAPKQGGPMFNNNGFWKAVNELKQQNDLAEEGLAEQQKRQTEMTQRAQAAATPPTKVAQPPAAPPPAAAKPAPAVAPVQERSGGGITPHTYVSNITIQGIGSQTVSFADADSQQATEGLLRQLAQAKGAYQ